MGSGSPARPLALAGMAALCTAAGAAASVFLGGADGIFGAGLFALAVAIAFIDARSLLIPDWLNVAVLLLGGARIWIQAEPAFRAAALADGLARAVVLGGVFYLVRLAYRRWRGGEGLGLGDVKLAAAGGPWLAWTMLPAAIEIAALSALAVYYVGPRLTGRPARWNERLPFGAFLAPAIWAAWLIGAWRG